MTVAERPVYLTIEASTGEHLTFILPEGLRDGYTNELGEIALAAQTHPTKHDWKSGKVNDVSLELELVVGVSHGIDSPEKLIRTIEMLYTMALKITPTQIGTVRVTIHGGGSSWFQRDYLISGIEANMGAPYDIDSGRPMKAKVMLSLKPTYSPGLSGTTADERLLPQRRYSFARG